VRLDRADIEAIAVRTADILTERGLVAQAAPLMTAEEIAGRFSVRPEWVRRNARRLGGVQLGDGPKARWRFDPETVAAALSSPPEEEPGTRPAAPRRRRRQRGPVRQLDPAELPVRTPRGRRKDG
jgi:hypothetical protein